MSKDCFSAKNYARKREKIGLLPSILPEEEYIYLFQAEKKKLRKLL